MHRLLDLTALICIFLVTQTHIIKGKQSSSFSKNKLHCRKLRNIAKPNIDCKYNPDDFLDVPQIIARHGYEAETHIVQTEDGYLLGVHRIPGTKDGRKGGQPVLLQHGLLGSSADWILNGNNSLAFTLADQGYDVWLGNARGNVYSRAHVSVPMWSAQFWNFSWHEMGTRDLPATLYHISNSTGKPDEIIYIGHSMGTTTFFVLSSTLPQVAKTVRLMIALAPTAFMTHIRSPIRYLAPFTTEYAWLAKHLKINMFLPSNKLLALFSVGCSKLHDKKLCQNLLLLLCGFNEKEINYDIMTTVFSHDPAGTSTKTILHYAQEVRNDGNFQQYDYGVKGNLIEYGTRFPPKYNLTNIKRPIALIYAENDSLASAIDVERLSKNLTNLVELYPVPSSTFSHIDFVFGKNAYELVYKHVLDVMRNFTAF